MTRTRGIPPELAGFDYVELIGDGGFADVFLYRQLMPTRDVAIKVLVNDTLEESGLELFYGEANTMAQLSGHPSIVPIYTAGVAPDGRPYLVMQYCPGPHLAGRYRTERISVAEALDTSIKIASAVETAHNFGILHRDIKPLNILTSAYGAPMLSDFGIAGTTGEGSTWSGGLSIPWSPPEAFWDEPPADVRSDVFSLAATTYTLLAGRSPFEIPGGANDNSSLMARIERQPLQRLNRADVSDALNDVFERGMAKSIEDRYASAAEYSSALQAVQSQTAATPTVAEVFYASNAAPPAAVDDNLTRARPIQVIVPEVVATRGTRIRPVVVGPKVDLGRSHLTSPDFSDRTQARGGPRSVDQGSRPSVMRLAPGTHEAADVAKPPSRAGLVIAGSVAALVAVASGVWFLASGPDNHTDRRNHVADAPGNAVAVAVDDPVAPTYVHAVVRGGRLVVTWKPVDAMPGDSYKLVNSDGVFIGRSTGTTASFPYSGQVCVQVQSVRGSNSSEAPCTPVATP